MTEEKDISIIIVSYNVKELLCKCIASIISCEGKLNFEIIIIDNDSQDESVTAIRLQFPQVIIIENNKNAGFPAANNQGFSISRGKYILMLNPDTELVDNALNKMIDYMKENQDANILAPKLLNSDRTIQNSVWRFPTLFSVFCESFHLKFLNGRKNYSDKSRDTVFEADSFSGAALLFKREIINKIGMLDETLFWIEDVDFCYRAKKAGLKIIYYPKATVIHHSGESAKKNYRISISNQVFNKIKFYKKHHTLLCSLFVILISFLSVLLKIILFTLLSPFNSIYFRKLQAYFFTLPQIINPPKTIA